MSDVYQPKLGSESIDLYNGAVPGDKVVPDGRMGRCIEGTLVRGRRRVCQSGISKGEEDGRNQGGFLYSDRRSTAGGEQSGASWRGGKGGVYVAITEERDEDQEGGGRGI